MEVEPLELTEYGRLADELSAHARAYLRSHTERLEMTVGQFLEGMILARWAKEIAVEVVFPAKKYGAPILVEFTPGEDGKTLPADRLLDHLVRFYTGQMQIGKQAGEADAETAVAADA